MYMQYTKQKQLKNQGMCRFFLLTKFLISRYNYYMSTSSYKDCPFFLLQIPEPENLHKMNAVKSCSNAKAMAN